jgi:hypothetical protein
VSTDLLGRPLPKYSKDLLGNIVSTKRVRRRILMDKYQLNSGRGWRKLRKWLRTQGHKEV